jgi:superfamily I DNA/RNA helicase
MSGGDAAVGPWSHRYQATAIDSLYKTQRTVTAWDGDLTVVVGGPGAAKSTTIGLLADRLTDEGDVDPGGCGILSFNRSVATETQQALRDQLGVRGHEVDVHTAHAKALDVCRRATPAERPGGSRIDIATEPDTELAMQAALEEADAIEGTIDANTIRNHLQMLQGLKRAGREPDAVDEALGDRAVYDTIEQVLDETADAAATLLRPKQVTPTTLDRLQSRLRVIGDQLEAALPADWSPTESPDAPLAHTAWAYVDLLRETTASAAAWFDANQTAICDDHPELAALPGYLLGDDQASLNLSGDVSAWPVSNRPYVEADRYLREVRETRDLLDIWRAYEAILADRELVDFEGALQAAVTLLETDPELRADVGLDRVMVDEAQDLSPQMLAFARQLADDVILFGDTAQTINEWAGANRYNIQRLLDEGANEITLPVDFRKAPGIENSCDAFRETINGEVRLDMQSHREDEDATWPETPIRWVQQDDDGGAAYEAVIDALETSSVPGWTVPQDASIATLARTGSTVGESQAVLAERGLADGPAGTTGATGVDRVCSLLRLLATLSGLEPTTPYIGHHADGDDDPLGPDALAIDEAPAIEALPDVLSWWFDIPRPVSEAALSDRACGPWIALARLADHDQDDHLQDPAYRPAFEKAYETLVELGRHTQRDRLPLLVAAIRDRCNLDAHFADPETALAALDEALADVTDPAQDQPPRPDLGAIQQLEDRWQAALTTEPTGRHQVSTVHGFKGSEADIVVIRNLHSEAWDVPANGDDAWDRDRAVSSLSRVRHRLAFDRCPATESFCQRKAHNERRVAYTAMSRARDLLVVIGRPGSTTACTSGSVVPDDCLPGSVERYETTEPFDVWRELQTAFDNAATQEWPRQSLDLDDGGEQT